MLTKLILLFLTIGQILASSFIEDGKRAEIFEIMDNEVPTLRVSIPDEKFKELKSALQTPKLEDVTQIVGVTEFEKVKNATMIVEINDTKKEFNNVTFDIGGSSARTYSRQGFNFKIGDKNKDLYGRTQFRLRSDPRDATYLRSKLSCDMLNRLGIVSVSANYAILYVNEEYFGFYIFMDAPKLPWVEQVYGEKDSQHLYKCKNGGNYLTLKMGMLSCENENDEVTDNSEWMDFITTLDNAKSVDDIKDVFDIDQFLYLAAWDYLVGAWDHFFMGGHNYSMYKDKNTGKWTMIYYDFDSDLGQDIVSIEFLNFNPLPDKNYPHYTAREWFHSQIPLNDIAIWNNLPEFEKKIAEVVNKVFNPTLLFPHIDEIKDFIRPYVLHDKTPGKDGINPGVLNLLNPTDYSMAQWEANSEFTTINEPSVGSDAYGIKYWILERYRAVCTHYNLECDPVYMDESYEYPIDEEVEGEINLNKWDGYDWYDILGIPHPSEVTTDVNEPTDEPIGEPDEEPTDEPIGEPDEEPTEVPTVKPFVKPTEEPTAEPTVEPTVEPTEKPTEKPQDIIDWVSNKLEKFLDFLKDLLD